MPTHLVAIVLTVSIGSVVAAVVSYYRDRIRWYEHRIAGLEEAEGRSCARCGSHHNGSARFCRICGVSLGEPDLATNPSRFGPEPELPLGFRVNDWCLDERNQPMLRWQCLECEGVSTDHWESRAMVPARRFIHALYCRECDRYVGEVLIDSAQYENPQGAIVQRGHLGMMEHAC